MMRYEIPCSLGDVDKSECSSRKLHINSFPLGTHGVTTQTFAHSASLVNLIINKIEYVGIMDDIPPEVAIEFLETLQGAFRVFDTTNTGKITINEIEQVMNSLGLFPTTHDLQMMQDTFSPTGILSFADFTRLFASSKLDYDREMEFREIFKALDRNCDGFVGVGELKYILDSLRIVVEREELEDMIAEYKGEIGFAAFCRIFGHFDAGE